MKWHLAIILAIIPLVGYSGEWDNAYIDSLYSGRQLDPIEGIWQFPKGGAKMAICKTRQMNYDIYLLDSPRLDVKPGTHIGSATNATRHNYYEGELTPRVLGKKDKLTSSKVTFTVNTDGILVIKPYKTGYNVSFKRWLYYLFKVSIVDNSSQRPNDLDGAVRIYPYKITDHLPVCL